MYTDASIFLQQKRCSEEPNMDTFHRNSQGQDTRYARECEFCLHMDPDFTQRKPMDRLVRSKMEDSASSHLTEDGYVRHRIAELMRKRAKQVVELNWLKSA